MQILLNHQVSSHASTQLLSFKRLCLVFVTNTEPLHYLLYDLLFPNLRNFYSDAP